VNLIYYKLVFLKNILQKINTLKKKNNARKLRWLQLFTETRFEENFTGYNTDAGKAA
jgi:hypothetical protein